jgi:ATP-dependent helicase/nuclease subunit B
MFLKTVAADLYKQFGKEVAQLAIIFPNKRPAAFFRQYLGNLIDQPIWCPDLLTIHEFLQLSESKLPADRLLQSFMLYEAYREITLQQGAEPTSYERFHPLGEILLNDYAELEANVISLEDLYGNMADLAAIDQGIDYLTEEQQEYLQRFWKNFSTERLSAQKEKFLQLWRQLPAIFNRFRELLSDKGLTTTGTLYRNLVAGTHSEQNFTDRYRQLVFVGFNALNRAELQLFANWKESGKAIFYFDADAHYIEDPLQEAGLFLRRNLELFGNALPLQNLVNRSDRPIHVIAAEGNAAQVRLLPQLLSAIPTVATQPERVAIFLADEQQLMPVLHALPTTIPFINITMGYGLVQSPVYSLVQAIIRVQESLQSSQGKRIYYHPLLQLLQHPYLYEVKDAATLVAQIHKRNLVNVLPTDWMAITEKRISAILTPVTDPRHIIALIRQVLELQVAAMGESAIARLEAQLISAAYFQLNRLTVLLDQFQHPLSLGFVGETILQVLRSLSVPLEGEPLKGLQIMGLLESRGLDFDHIIVLNVNEGALPKKAIAPTFIPDSIRRAFGLSVMEKQDAIFAYVFYRLLQYSQTVYCLYNSTVNDQGPGEKSRFLTQLEYETQIPFVHQRVDIPITPEARAPITIAKDEKAMTTLRRYLKEPLTPSAINNYIECKLRFYFRHLQQIREPDLFTEDVDARVLGNILHKTMEGLYKLLAEKKENEITVDAADFPFLKENLDLAIDQAFGEELAGGPDERVTYSGAYAIVRSVIRIYAEAVLAADARHAPFRMHFMEAKLNYRFPVVANGVEWPVVLGGIIDRVDEKDGVYRIIDYKTGRDKKNFASVEALFDASDAERNKAALQTFIYLYILQKELRGNPPVVAGLYDVRNMRKDGEDFDWRFVETAQGALTEAEMPPLINATIEKLKEVVAEIFDDRVPFDQTVHLDKCTHCDYQALCGR